MPANNRRALQERFPAAMRKDSHPVQTNSVRKPDSTQMEPGGLLSAAEMFRRCSEQNWDHSAWEDWFNWAKAVSDLKGRDRSKLRRKFDSKYTVSWSGSDSLIGTIPGAFLRDDAEAVLKEFNLEDALSNFDEFWETIHACIRFQTLTPAALKMDHEIYGGAFGYAEMLEEDTVTLRRKGLLR